MQEDDQGFETTPRGASRLGKVADRPHWITIALAFLGPAVTVLAVWMAARSLQLSQEAVNLNQTAMRVAQRAYVSVKDGIVTISEPAFQYEGNGLGGNASLNFSVVIDNLGNTPARNVGYCMRVVPVDEDWIPDTPYRDHRWTGNPGAHHDMDSFACRDNLGEIQGKDSIESAGWIHLWIRDPAMYAYIESKKHGPGITGTPPPVMRFEGRVDYTDIFGERGTAPWCWNVNIFSDRPERCVNLLNNAPAPIPFNDPTFWMMQPRP